MINYQSEDIADIFDRYKSVVYRCSYAYCKNSFDSNDIVQEVFLRYIKTAPAFESEEHRKAWLIRVTINCCKKMLGASFRKRTTELDETISFEQQENSDLYYVIMDLPTKYRMVIHLYYFENYTVGEIAQATKKSYGSVSTMLYRARAMIKEKLEKRYYYDEKTVPADV